MLLVEVAVILLAAKIAGDLASRWGQPPVVGQLVAGLAMGILVFAVGQQPLYNENEPQLAQLANLGVLLLMFLAGLETDWNEVRATGKAAFTSASVGVAIQLGVGYAVGLAFHLAPLEALFLGVILTATSISISAQTLLELGSLQTTAGATILGAAVSDDVIGVVVFSLVVAGTGMGQVSEPMPVVVLRLLVFFAIAPTVGNWLCHRILDLARDMRGSEVSLAAALALTLIFAVAAIQSGIAGVTGAYVAGLLINRQDRYGELTEKVKVVAYGLFVPIFLVKIGMDAHLESVGPVIGMVAAVSLSAIVAKFFGCALGARVCGLTSHQSLVVGAGMVPRGEVALIVASLALQANVVSTTVFAATIVVVLVTALVTPLLLRLALTRGVMSAAPQFSEAV